MKGLKNLSQIINIKYLEKLNSKKETTSNFNNLNYFYHIFISKLFELKTEKERIINTSIKIIWIKKL